MSLLPISRLTAEQRRKVEFLFVGGSVMAFSFVQLWLLIDVFGLNYWIAYAIQTVVSVELNFFGNFFIAWRDKKESIRLGRAHSLFWLTRGVMVIANPFVFAFLVKMGIAYLLAQIVIIAVNTVLNYVAADKLAFGGKWVAKQAEETDQLNDSHDDSTKRTVTPEYPFVSIVVPVKARQGTIRELIASFLKQDYIGSSELILVGDLNDPTWTAITDYIENGQVRVIEAVIDTEDRDANAKRNVGLNAARGDVLALTDSDVILPPSWLSHGTALMQSREGYQVVAGSLKSIKESGFWSSYTDDNPFGSKTPRMTPAYVLDQDNSGRGRFKQPITASMFISRKVYDEIGGLDADFVTPYEDYPYADVIIRAGYEILCDGDLVAYHYHREGFNDLTREYWKAGYGCADYVLKYSFSRLAASRALQLLIVAVGLVVGFVALAIAPLVAVGCALTGLTMVSLLTYYKLRHVGSLVFPYITGLLSVIFAAGMVYGFCKRFWTNQKMTSIVSVYEDAAVATLVQTTKVG